MSAQRSAPPRDTATRRRGSSGADPSTGTPPPRPDDRALYRLAWSLGSIEAAAARYGLSSAEVGQACDRWAARMTRERMLQHTRG